MSWIELFGSSSLDSHVDVRGHAGTPWLILHAVIDRLICSGWNEWIDPGSGSRSAVAPTAKVWQGASVRNSVLCPNVVVGHCSEVLESIVLDNAKINHLNSVGRSVIGCDVSISSHVVVASHRLDQKPIPLPQEEFEPGAQAQKFGALVGSRVRVGAHSLVDAGVIVHPDTIILPYSMVGRSGVSRVHYCS